MPTLTSTDERLTPGSTLRHRPIAAGTSQEELPRIRRASRTRTQKPTVKMTTPTDIPAWKPATRLRPRRRQRIPIVSIGIGMVIAVIAVMLGQLLLSWIGITWNNLQYGYPRTFQVDAVVGQGDSTIHPSHFIALNLHGQIEVIDLPASNASHAKIYLGPHLYGPNADLVPVTLQFVNNRNHQPDMLVRFQDQQIVFRNAQGSFHAPPTSS
jgi:hypothetical protein